ncbi:ATP-binding protein [Streptomyces sp. NPDC004542]|uniref:ATP-binding protein n=1 Tax=Streptomyces sp. NPDC004542 TaxID=3154281 RepID=UPI0033AE6E18
MSLPLTRRIARAALLVAAGAAAGVGAAGSAGAATNLPATTPDLGGLTALDGAKAGNAVDSTTQHVTKVAGETGGQAVKKAVPAAGKAGGKVLKKATPAAQKTAGDVAGTAGGVLGDTASSATKGGLPTDALTKGGLTGKGGLPTTSLPAAKGVQLGG